MSGYLCCLLYWYRSTNTDAAVVKNVQYSFHILYWYKSTNTDAAGTKVQILTQLLQATPVNVKRALRKRGLERYMTLVEEQVILRPCYKARALLRPCYKLLKACY